MPEATLDYWVMREKLSAPYAKRQAEKSEDCDPQHAHFTRAQSNSHDQGDRDRSRNRENAPWTLCQSLHDDQRQNGQQDNHDRQDTDQREESDLASNFFSHHLTQCLPVPADRGEKNDHIVDTTAERCADQYPESAGKETELRRQYRSN